MQLSDAFEKLSFGPLSDLSIGGNGSGTIPEAKQPQVINRINGALLALYTRFPLQLRTIRIETSSLLHLYPLRRQFAETSDSLEPIKFIKDSTAQPFLEDVAKVIGIANHDNKAMGLNNSNDPESWHLIAYDTLSFDYPKDLAQFFVHYRARHALIDLKEANPENTEIRIPPELESAFMHHVAGNIFSGMGMEGSLAKSQGHLSAYENECSFLDDQNTFDQWSMPSGLTYDTFRAKGWV